MVLSESLFWVVWRSLDGREQSTLHPYSVPAVQNGVDAKLQAQYAAFAKTQKHYDRQAANVFCQTLLRPDYVFAGQPYSTHAAISAPMPDDRIRCRSIAVQSPQQSSAECDYNVMFHTQYEQLDPFQYLGQPAPYYETTPDEHARLVKLRGQQPADCLFQPSRDTRKLLKLVQKFIDPTPQNG